MPTRSGSLEPTCALIMARFAVPAQALASEMQREKEAQNGEQPVVKPVTKPKERARKPLAE